jgi:GNAT superfamily N-acetyltransferase
MDEVVYAREDGLSVEDFQMVLADSGLGSRRPMDDADRLGRMLRHANLIVTARIDGELVGVSRALTDFAHCCYLADLAVAERAKGKGVGQQLIAETRRHAGPESMCLLLAAPDAESFYDHIGMPRCERAFMYPRDR